MNRLILDYNDLLKDCKKLKELKINGALIAKSRKNNHYKYYAYKALNNRYLLSLAIYGGTERLLSEYEYELARDLFKNIMKSKTSKRNFIKVKEVFTTLYKIGYARSDKEGDYYFRDDETAWKAMDIDINYKSYLMEDLYENNIDRF